MRSLSLIFTLFLFESAAVAKPVLPLSPRVRSLPHLAEGRPGCFELIRNQSLNQKQVSALPKDCQGLRSDYLASLDLISKHPDDYAKNLNSFLSNSRTVRAPYEAILFAYLLNHQSVHEGLVKRAKVEQKLKLPFQYALVVSQLIQGKVCVDLGKRYQNPAYAELCTSKDRLLSELYLAHRSSQKSNQSPKKEGAS